MKNKRTLGALIIAVLSLTISACNLLPTNFSARRRSSLEESQETQPSSNRRPSSNNDRTSSRNPSSSSNSPSSSRSSSSSRTPSSSSSPKPASSSSSEQPSSQHEHTFDYSLWEHDDVCHWHPSTCGHNVIVDNEAHIFGEPFDVIPSTCTFNGSHKEMCTVCGYTREITDGLVDHTWMNDNSQEMIQPTKSATGKAFYVCSICGTRKSEDIFYGETIETALTVDEALDIGEPLQNKEFTERKYYVHGFITEIPTAYNQNYNNLTFWLASSENSRGFECYRVTLAEGVDPETLKVGAEVIAFGQIYRYNTTIEFYTVSNTVAYVVQATLEEQPITSIEFDPDVLYVPLGTKKEVNMICLPFYGNSTIKWHSENPYIATTTYDGDVLMVVGNGVGFTSIVAYIDANGNDIVDGIEVQGIFDVTVEEPNYLLDSATLLNYNGETNVEFNAIYTRSVGDINYDLDGTVSAYVSDNGAMRLKRGGHITGYDYPAPISKIVIEKYRNSRCDISVYKGAQIDELMLVTPNEKGEYIFNVEEDIRTFTIKNNDAYISYINSICVFLELPDVIDDYDGLPIGNFSGYLMAEGIQNFVNLAIGDGVVSMQYYTDKFETEYSYDENTHLISFLFLNEDYGIFTGYYNHTENIIFYGSLSGETGALFTNNGNIKLTGAKMMWNCDDSEETLKTIFKRRYRPDTSQWVVDTDNEDRLLSYTPGISSNAVSVRPYRNGAIALNLADDLERPIDCTNFGFWVFNPSDTEITLRVWMYKGTGHTNSVEVFNAKALPNQWTYCLGGFQPLSAYNFQIADFTNSGVRLAFDNICLF